MPTLLYIDTSANHITIAVSRDGQMMMEQRQYTTHEQAALINVMIAAALEASGLTLQETDAIVVCAGPGSYTGLRVALSAAKGLCFALNKPLMLFNKLFLLDVSLPLSPEANILIALKARQEEFFIAAYDGNRKEVLPPQHACSTGIRDILSANDIHTVVTNYDDPSVFEGRNILPVYHEINMEQWMSYAESRYAKKDFDDLAYSDPFYLKAAFTTTAKKKI